MGGSWPSTFVSEREEAGRGSKGTRLATTWSMWQCRRHPGKEGFGKGARVSVIQEVQSG